jgi:hypothetical protein
MDNLEVKLREMSKIEPSKGFIKASKNRLMQQIELQQNESWFKSFLGRMGMVHPRSGFLSQARARLMHRISEMPQPIAIPLKGFARTLLLLKRITASAMVMVLAVTSTLFFVEGNTVVEASDDSYLEVIAGKVSVKHADLLLWETINGQIEMQAGDLIKVEEGSQALVHFFDDTELRLGENTTFLISQLAISPNFSRQGIIEVSLHEGSAWVQTMNVNDGYAGFVLSTRDSLIKALSSTVSVKTALKKPTEILVLNNKVELTTLRPETRQMVDTMKVSNNEKAIVYASTGNAKPVVTTAQINEQDLANEWVQTNLRLDSEHRAQLREKGIERLTQTAGTLPGQMLYPIKQAKERLKLLVLSSDSQLSAQIEIANNRLNEAIVLLENGDIQKGREALMAYQSIARQIAESTGREEITEKLLLPHQKTLAADLPNDANIGLVKETLHETAEILADSPIELEKVRLANSVERLRDILNLVEIADFAAARDRLVSHQLVGGDVLTAVSELDNESQKAVIQEVLELRQEEVSLLNVISKSMEAVSESDEQLVAMLESATETAEENVDETIAFATPLVPELVAVVTQPPSATDLKIAELVDKIYVYNSWTGQQNQIERLLKNELKNTSSIPFLIEVRNKLKGRASDYLNVHILQLQRKAELQQQKAAQRRAEREQRLREAEAEASA